ncbi:MAG: thiamine phosphate synthase [Pseudomonadota bacterium]
MARRNTRLSKLPTRWLFTDPTRTPDVAAAIGRLERGDGVVFRHYEAPDRLALAREARRAARRRGVLFLVAGDAALARRVGADGLHMPGFGRVPRPLTAAAHTLPDLVRARRAGAQLVFLSPVYATRSHVDAVPLGRVRFGLSARSSPIPVAGLGGMTARKYRTLRSLGASAWGAIDAFL